MNTIKTLLILTLLVIAGCSGGDDTNDDHVWKDQTDALDKAKQTEQMLMDSADKQRQSIEQQSQ